MRFREWFENQFGERPSRKPQWELMAEFEDLQAKANMHQALLDSCIEWDKKATAAQYAWNIKEEDKN